MTARLQRSAGGVLLTLLSWSSHLFLGRPGHRLQLGSGRRPSDKINLGLYNVARQGLVGRTGVQWRRQDLVRGEARN